MHRKHRSKLLKNIAEGLAVKAHHGYISLIILQGKQFPPRRQLWPDQSTSRNLSISLMVLLDRKISRSPSGSRSGLSFILCGAVWPILRRILCSTQLILIPTLINSHWHEYLENLKLTFWCSLLLSHLLPFLPWQFPPQFCQFGSGGNQNPHKHHHHGGAVCWSSGMTL